MNRLLTSAWLLILLTSLPAAAQDWQPIAGDDFQNDCAAALKKFRDKDKLQRFFKEAHALVIFPSVKRVGLAFGTAWGKGLVIRGDETIGRAGQRQLSLGPQFGGQVHSQIIFFRDEAALETFQQGRREFLGRASATGVVWGGAAEPVNLPEVAIFSDTTGGLMLELAAAGIRYRYEPVDPAAD